jgi:hypothetical protein
MCGASLLETVTQKPATAVRLAHREEKNMKYICFGYYDKSKFESMTEGERDAMFDTCLEYDEQLKANGHWAGGEALQSETAVTLTWKNGKAATTDGPYAETKEQLGGILILEARDLDTRYSSWPNIRP